MINKRNFLRNSKQCTVQNSGRYRLNVRGNTEVQMIYTINWDSRPKDLDDTIDAIFYQQCDRREFTTAILLS